jgi:preprotein translocase subunit SecD
MQNQLAENATDQAMKIIDTRINTLGVTEPTLQRHGAQSSHQILLQMPGISDSRARQTTSESTVALGTCPRRQSAESFVRADLQHT